MCGASPRRIPFCSFSLSKFRVLFTFVNLFTLDVSFIPWFPSVALSFLATGYIYKCKVTKKFRVWNEELGVLCHTS